MRRAPRSRRGLILGAAAAAILPATAALATTSSTSAPTFSNYSLAETPGVTCPGSTACSNTAAEPQIRSAPNGYLYGSSENGLGGGTVAFRSTNGGSSFTTLTSPNAVSSLNTTGLAPGGGDTDLATATARNSAGNYNVYVASLSLANVDVSTSRDNGATWALNPVGAMIPGDDREWIAAEGASKVCVNYHDVATFNIDVNCSMNAGATFTQLATAIDPAHAYLINNNEIGNISIDPVTHNVYVLFSGIASATEVPGSELAGNPGYHAVWLAVSTNGGKSFTDHLVYDNPNPAVSYGHQFVQISLDRAGNLYAVFSDNHNVYYAYSTDHGATWSAPAQVNSGSAVTAIEPWSVAGDAGKLDIVYYGTPYYQAGTVPDNYPTTAAWKVYFAQNAAATTPGSSFSQVAASPVNHYGGVCEGGISCTGNRDLYDDFGVAADPNTGLASIIYSDDQYAAGGPNTPGCTAAANNSSSCDHTAIAHQTSGTGIYATSPTPVSTPPGHGHQHSGGAGHGSGHGSKHHRDQATTS